VTLNSQPPETLSVSQLNRQVKRLLEDHFQYVWVEGEVSNFVRPGSGHWYFTLKDDTGQVRCAMFRNRNQRIREQPSNGKLIRLRARVSLYEGRGEYQLIVEHVEAAGAGALQLAFERLKQRLLEEGLFEQEHKKPLPLIPKHIGLITSPTGAAIRDMITVFRRRFPGVQLSILPVPVQGEGAAQAMVAALGHANKLGKQLSPPLDALIIGRGGGSIEDLWSFNDENLARALFNSELPVVSAVGHETDFTIADFVADARAPTPSAAAELLSPDRAELLSAFRSLEKNLQRSAQRSVRQAELELANLSRRLRHPGDKLREQAQRLDELEFSLARACQRTLAQRRQSVLLLQSQLARRSPALALAEKQLRVQHLGFRHVQASQQRLARLQERLARLGGVLHSLSPLATLDRGYALVTNQQHEVITDSQQLRENEILTTRLARGQFSSRVTEVD
jgi:exodeoxyribonuclease VII large subunit